MTTPTTEAGQTLVDAPDVLLMKSDDEIIGLNEGELELQVLAIEAEAARVERRRMREMRHDYQTLPHAEFPIRWPDWRDYEDVLPTTCFCRDCRLWRSGS